MNDVKRFGNLPIPMEIRNAPTELMKEIGYGEKSTSDDNDSLLPDELKDKKYLD
jgi:putative ATPase